MKIAIISLNFWPLVGGMEIVAHEQATTLNKMGHNIVLFTTRPRIEFNEIKRNYELVRFGWRIRGFYRFGVNKLYLLWEFIKRNRNEPFDVIQVHGASPSGSYGIFLKKIFNLPLIITCHGKDVQVEPSIGYGERLNRRKDNIIRRNLLGADTVVAISKSMVETLIELVPSEKIESIPNGIFLSSDKESFRPWLREKLKLKDSFIILIIGRNHVKKDFQTALKSLKEIQNRGCEDVVMVHLGSGGSKLSELALNLCIKEKFIALGIVSKDEVFSAMCEADVFLSTAIVESFGLITYEAMSARLLCIVTDAPGNRDAVQHGRNGYIVSVGGVKEIADQIESLYFDIHIADRLRDEASRRVKSYSWEKVCRMYLNIYEKLTCCSTIC